MSTITLKGNPVNTVGELPAVGSKAKDFTLIKRDLSTVHLSDFEGKLVLNIFPSIDTGTCAASVRKFNELAAGMPDTQVLCISRDLPFAHIRFCGVEGIENVEMLSDFVDASFGKDYGLLFADGPLTGLHSRCLIVLDQNKEVIYTQQVPETTDEPNYDETLEALQ